MKESIDIIKHVVNCGWAVEIAIAIKDSQDE